MKIDGVLSNINTLQKDENLKLNANNSFEKFFDAALNLYNETNKYQLNAEKLQIDYVTGKTDDIIGLNMAQSKASTSLQFTTQVTNKIITAYQEIMRMSI